MDTPRQGAIPTWGSEKVINACAQLIRIEVTRSGHFNPGFKEAPHASEGVF
jgi:hypothetical protein